MTLESFGRASYHAHLHIIENVCSKFHLDDLKTVGA